MIGSISVCIASQRFSLFSDSLSLWGFQPQNEAYKRICWQGRACRRTMPCSPGSLETDRITSVWAVLLFLSQITPEFHSSVVLPGSLDTDGTTIHHSLVLLPPVSTEECWMRPEFDWFSVTLGPSAALFYCSNPQKSLTRPITPQAPTLNCEHREHNNTLCNLK